MAVKKNGVLPVSDDTPSFEGMVELNKETVERMKDEKFAKQLKETEDESRKIFVDKINEFEDGEEEKFLKENGLVPLEAVSKEVKEAEVKKTAEANTSDDDGDDDDTPAYSADEEDDDDDWGPSIVADETESLEDLSKEVGNYEIIEATNERTVLRTYIHEKPVLSKLENKRLNAITDEEDFEKFLLAQRKKYKDKVSMPLINSGIMVDFIGAGAFDYAELYSTRPEDASIKDALNRMKVMTKNIIGVEPKIDPSKLLDNISYIDYQLATHGFCSATIPELEVPHKCECNQEFIVKTPTIDMILNAKEIEARWKEIEKLPLKERGFKKAGSVEFLDGYMVVKTEVPSFATVKKAFQKIENAVNTKKVTKNIYSMINILINISSFEMDGNVIYDPIFIYKFLLSLDTKELQVISDNIANLYEGIITPEFGFTVNCPACGKENKQVFSTIEELIFFHLLVERMLSSARFQKKNTTNG